MKTLLQGWHFARILRLILGVIIIVQGVILHETAYALMGGLLSLMAVVNVGCCGPAGCSVPTKSKSQSTSQPIEFEEMK